MNKAKFIKKYLITCLAILVFSFSTAVVAANSLWVDTSMYDDGKASGIGDILTIIVNEASSASKSGQTNNSKAVEGEVKAGLGIFSWIDSANMGQSDSFKAQGSTINKNSMTARLTVKVVDIQPNGDLVLLGTQLIKQNKEEQKITISGVVRPQDIRADNTVLSTYVADAKITMEGKGPLAAKQRQGILSQIFDFLF